MLDRADIINLALARIGVTGVAQPFEDTEEGRAAMRVYDVARRLLLAEHPWRFASKKQVLYPVAPAEDGVWTYTEPGGALRVVGLKKDGRFVPWEYEEGIRCAFPNPVCVYVRDMPAPFPEAFADALACRIALEISPWAEQSDNMRNLYAMLSEAKTRAELWDAQYGGPRKRRRALEERFDAPWEKPIN